MVKKRLYVGLVGLLGLAGCANLAGEVAKRADAPDWFKSRVREIEGDGYPKFSNANLTPKPNKTAAEWAAVEADLAAAKKSVDTDPRAINPGPLRDPQSLQAAAKVEVPAIGVER